MSTNLRVMPNNCIIRPAKVEDAEVIMTYAEHLFRSTDQVLTTPEEYTITLEQEEAWIRGFEGNANSLLLVAETQGRVVALLDFSAKIRWKARHSGELGLSVHPEYQRQGLGRAMMEVLIAWARSAPGVEKLILQVFETNHKAILLYQSLGFKEEGRFVKGIKQSNGAYVDLIQMYLWVK